MKLRKGKKRKGIYPRKVPPRGARQIRFTEWKGEPEPVYEKEFPTIVKEPVLDPETGEQATRQLTKDTQPAKRYKVSFKPVKKEFILISTPMGNVRMQFNFEVSEEEKQARQRRQQIEEFQENLAEALVDRGMTIPALLNKLGIGTEDESLVEEAEKAFEEAQSAMDEIEDVPVPEVEIRQRENAPGYWDVYVDGARHNEKALRHDDAQEYRDEIEDAYAGV